MATAASNMVPCIRCEQEIQQKIDTPAEAALKYSVGHTPLSPADRPDSAVPSLVCAGHHTKISQGTTAEHFDECKVTQRLTGMQTVSPTTHAKPLISCAEGTSGCELSPSCQPPSATNHALAMCNRLNARPYRLPSGHAAIDTLVSKLGSGPALQQRLQNTRKSTLRGEKNHLQESPALLRGSHRGRHALSLLALVGLVGHGHRRGGRCGRERCTAALPLLASGRPIGVRGRPCVGRRSLLQPPAHIAVWGLRCVAGLAAGQVGS